MLDAPHPTDEGVRILSQVRSENFPALWYELASEEHFWCRWRLRAFLRQLRDLQLPLQDPLLGLEIGCGNGLVRRQLEGATAWTVDGADIDLAVLKTNQTRRGASYLYNVHDRVEALKERYDFLLLFDVIEHIPDAETTAFLESCLFHLKPGGHLLLNVPALMSLFSKYDTFVGHFRRYDQQTMEAELTRAGLQVVDLRYWGFGLVPLLQLRQKMIARKKSEREVVNMGFRPPSPLLNRLLSVAGSVETRLLARPPRGTSLLAAAVKE